MKPKPFSALNHFTVPCATAVLLVTSASTAGETGSRAAPGGSNETSEERVSAHGPRQKFRECEATNTQNDGLRRSLPGSREIETPRDDRSPMSPKRRTTLLRRSSWQPDRLSPSPVTPILIYRK